MDTQTVITLLTITVSLLSGIVLVMLAVIIAILLKLRKMAQNLESVLNNIAEASEWLTPTKIIGQVINLFRK
jgi:hypothetical protein